MELLEQQLRLEMLQLAGRSFKAAQEALLQNVAPPSAALKFPLPALLPAGGLRAW